MAPKENIFQVFKPFYYLTKLCGYIPFTVYFEEKNRMENTKIDFLISVIFLILSLIIIRLTMDILPKKDEQVKSLILVLGMSIGIFAVLLQTLSIPFVNFFCRKKFIKFMKNMNDFDQKVNYDSK